MVFYIELRFLYIIKMIQLREGCRQGSGSPHTWRVKFFLHRRFWKCNCVPTSSSESSSTCGRVPALNILHLFLGVKLCQDTLWWQLPFEIAWCSLTKPNHWRYAARQQVPSARGSSAFGQLSADQETDTSDTITFSKSTGLSAGVTRNWSFVHFTFTGLHLTWILHHKRP